jgi:hypothetical protein
MARIQVGALLGPWLSNYPVNHPSLRAGVARLGSLREPPLLEDTGPFRMLVLVSTEDSVDAGAVLLHMESLGGDVSQMRRSRNLDQHLSPFLITQSAKYLPCHCAWLVPIRQLHGFSLDARGPR